MMKFIFTILIFVVFDCYSQNDIQIKLLDITKESKIDTSNFNKLQFIERGILAIDSVFKPIKGSDCVLRYIIEDSLVLMGGPEQHKQLVNIIITIQIDKNNRIIDGYFYCLHNPVYAYCELYRISNKNLCLKNNIKLKKLNFKLFEFYKGYTCNEFEKTEIFNVYSRLLIPFE